jgi:hypothetical protein
VIVRLSALRNPHHPNYLTSCPCSVPSGPLFSFVPETRLLFLFQQPELTTGLIYELRPPKVVGLRGSTSVVVCRAAIQPSIPRGDSPRLPAITDRGLFSLLHPGRLCKDEPHTIRLCRRFKRPVQESPNIRRPRKGCPYLTPPTTRLHRGTSKQKPSFRSRHSQRLGPTRRCAARRIRNTYVTQLEFPTLRPWTQHGGFMTGCAQHTTPAITTPA